MSRFFRPYHARPANPEECTHIEDHDGNLILIVEGMGGHHEDYAFAQALANAANEQGLALGFFSTAFNEKLFLLAHQGSEKAERFWNSTLVREIRAIVNAEGGQQ